MNYIIKLTSFYGQMKLLKRELQRKEEQVMVYNLFIRMII
jgi:hypothetical protein